MRELKIQELEAIEGGGFCQGFAIGVGIYGIGVAANWWNPVGWVGGSAIALTGIGCAIYGLS